MAKDGLDDITEDMLREENPTATAVNSLITVKERETGKPSEVELKTDLDENEIKIHTVLDVLSNVMEMSEEQFGKSCILSEVIHRKERKAISKRRQSRSEIVAVARQPDNINQEMGMEQQGFIKRFFSPKR